MASDNGGERSAGGVIGFPHVKVDARSRRRVTDGVSHEVAEHDRHALRVRVDLPGLVLLRFEPAETLESGLARTVQWYFEHEEWWRDITKGGYGEWVRRQYGDRDAPAAPR